VKTAVSGGTPAPAPAPAAARPAAAPAAPASSYGLAAREVGADAAIAAGLPAEGSLAAESALHVFGLAAAMQGTGRLSLGTHESGYALSFRRGNVEHVRSTDPADDVGRFLVARGAVKPDALARAEAARAKGGDLVSALITERAVNPADVAALLQEHGAVLVQRALAVQAGSWGWDPQAPAVPGAFPLGNAFAMLNAAVRTLDASAVARRLGDREHRVAARIGGRVRVEDLRLTAQEARVAGLFDGARSPAELAAANPADAVTILRLALLLGELQLLSFGAGRTAPPPAPPPAQPPRQAAPPPPARPAVTPAPAGRPAAPAPGPAAGPAVAPAPAARSAPSAAAPAAASPRPGPAPAQAAHAPRPAAPAKPATTPAPAATPSSAARPAIDAGALKALVAKLKDADHFAALGVKQDAAGPQIKIAYFQLAKSYHPDAVPTDASPEVKKLCADVFAKVSEAWSVLADDRSRAEYLQKLRTGGTAEVDVARIFEAENLFQTGTLLVKARNYVEALKKIDEAIALNADEAEFGMWKAWCEFLLADDKRKKMTVCASAIEVGLKKNPMCAQGYLFLGQMAKIVGDLALAEKHLKRGLGVAPDHADLQRELKYLRK
jgi:DnaJ-domain-containing protein 1